MLSSILPYIRECRNCRKKIRRPYLACFECIPILMMEAAEHGPPQTSHRFEDYVTIGNCSICGQRLDSHTVTTCVRCRNKSRDEAVCVDCGANIADRPAKTQRCSPCAKEWTTLREKLRRHERTIAARS